ncbi:hypothetical protein AYI68_g350 [Smittium mucronatum]|uniref:Uncharacterized protein n=1 Tax=Smittium mucronatum TaxID=133383 RepID=A0A1R0H8G7_9FUNG|nr:hypothetical protein AYI68_g350 [Smittium mucronatum]
MKLTNFNQSAGSRVIYNQLKNNTIDKISESEKNSSTLKHEVLNRIPTSAIKLNNPEVIRDDKIRLPDAVHFYGILTNYQEFISSMALNFRARLEVLKDELNRILYIGDHLTYSATMWFGSLIESNSASLISFTKILRRLFQEFLRPN